MNNEKIAINITHNHKVIKNGNGRYVSIPKHIVDMFNIEEGDILEFKIINLIKK